MKAYRVEQYCKIPCGRICLDESQAAKRAPYLKHLHDQIYEIMQPINFKAGEIIGLEKAIKGLPLISLDASSKVIEDNEQAIEITAELIEKNYPEIAEYFREQGAEREAQSHGESISKDSELKDLDTDPTPNLEQPDHSQHTVEDLKTALGFETLKQAHELLKENGVNTRTGADSVPNALFQELTKTEERELTENSDLTPAMPEIDA